MKKAEKTKDVQYYTKERWNNWIQSVKESKFQINEGHEDDTLIFVNMMDDVILSCLNVISGYKTKDKRKKLSADDALSAIADISEIVLGSVEPINEDVDMMIQSLQSSLLGALVSCECYVRGTYNKKTPLPKLIKDAIKVEEDNPEEALECMSAVGARVLSGKPMPEITFDVPDGLVAEWLDGIDSIVAAMALSGNE
ncbi:MAG: DUF2150 family protein [Methanosarcinales archaeon]|nr:DUF2150 family protein [Methanosarcinales archaeon]HDJ37664.1 DUF2150 family protein [Methanosarcinales archaeon]